jgi:elongation factor G
MGIDSEVKVEIVTAQFPIAEIMEYAPDLISITGGRGTYSSEFSHYEELPGQLAEKVIADANKEE